MSVPNLPVGGWQQEHSRHERLVELGNSSVDEALGDRVSRLHGDCRNCR